jgi:hypothetical protein
VKIRFVWHLLSTVELEGCHSGHSTIDVLPDDVLLCIFDSCRRLLDRDGIWPWHTFVHVCQRWRRVIFGSPCYLRLHLVCKCKKDVQKMLDIWPALLYSADTRSACESNIKEKKRKDKDPKTRIKRGHLLDVRAGTKVVCGKGKQMTVDELVF